MSVKSKHSSKKEKAGKKEKKKKIEDFDDDIESSEEELDLTKECHPIGYYMNDRAEMINQMFSVIKGNKLKAMLPPILKECDIEQLKLQCLDQLLGMSEKRISCILEGETLDTSSESEVQESDEFESDEKNKSSSSSCDRSNESHEINYTNNIGHKRKEKKRKGDLVNEGKSGKLPKTETSNGPQEQGKTLLEILELEMRARAIRALLKQSGNEKGGDQVNDENTVAEVKNRVEEVTSEVVDLTKDEEFLVNVKKEISYEIDNDKKVSTFEEKVEKSQTEKSNFAQENEKSKRLQAEFELRNKLFKKKIYRTRQQRMENEEEDKNLEKNDIPSKENNSGINVNPVIIKQEPVEPKEWVVEDPEEGEISTSEDEYPVEIKKEVVELEILEQVEDTEYFERKMGEDAERVTAIDNGSFVKNCNLENIQNKKTKTNEDLLSVVKVEECSPENKNHEKEKISSLEKNQDIFKEKKPAESDDAVEGTSWRDRWLQKDGVQKLVKSSKIYAKVKKRIAEKTQKAKEEVPMPYEANSDSNSNSRTEVIEGSIEEYEKLLNKSSKDNNINNESSHSQQLCSEEIIHNETKYESLKNS